MHKGEKGAVQAGATVSDPIEVLSLIPVLTSLRAKS